MQPSPTQKRKREEIADTNEKKRKFAEAPVFSDSEDDSDGDVDVDFDKVNGHMAHATQPTDEHPIEDTVTAHHDDVSKIEEEDANIEEEDFEMPTTPAHNGAIEVVEDDSEMSDAGSVVLGEEKHQEASDKPAGQDLSQVPSSSTKVSAIQEGNKSTSGKKKNKQRAKPIYNHNGPSVLPTQKTTKRTQADVPGQAGVADDIANIGGSGVADEPNIADEATVNDDAAVAKQTDNADQAGEVKITTRRRRCPEFDTLVLSLDESLFTVEIPFDVMDPMVNLMGEDSFTGRGVNDRWLDKYRDSLYLDDVFPQNSVGKLASQLQHIFTACNEFTLLYRAEPDPKFLGDPATAKDQRTIAGMINLMKTEYLSAVMDEASVEDRALLAHDCIPMAVAAAFMIFLGGEDPKGTRVYLPMMAFKVLRQIVGVVFELAKLLDKEMGEYLASLCPLLIEHITHSMDRLGVAVVNDRKATAAALIAQQKKATKDEARNRRTQQFIASVETFLGEEDHETEYLSPREFDDFHIPAFVAEATAFEEPLYTTLVTEVCTQARPRIDVLAKKLRLSKNKVRELIFAIAKNAATLEAEDGKRIPPKVERGFRHLFGHDFRSLPAQL